MKVVYTHNFMPISSIVTILIFAIAFVCFSTEASFGTDFSGKIPLEVDTGGTPASSGFPVSSGIPFPFAHIYSTDQLQLIDASGKKTPAQFNILSSWHDRSIKSVLVTFFPENTGDKFKQYWIEYKNPSAPQSSSEMKSITLTQDIHQITVDTGAAKFAISKEHFTLFDQVYIGQTEVLKSPGDLVFEDNKTGGTFRSSLFERKDGYKVSIVEDGPLRTVLKAEGKARGMAGCQTEDRDRDLVVFRVWLTFYANSGIVHIKYTLIDSKSRTVNLHEPQKPILSIRDNRFVLPLADGNFFYTAGGEANNVYRGKVEGEKFLFQDAVREKSQALKGYSYAWAYQGVGSGERAPGWMDVSWGRVGVTVALRYFRENYPEKLSIEDTGKLSICLQPKDSLNIFSTDYPGEAKTYDIFLDFHEGGFSDNLRKKAELFMASPVIKTSPEWYARSEIFGPIALPGQAPKTWEQKIERQFECSSQRKNCSIYPTLYGKTDFGDYQMGYNTMKNGEWVVNKGIGHYEDAHGWILEFLRQGEKKFLDFAIPFAINHYDVGVMHAENPSYPPGFPAGMIHWHGGPEKVELGHAVPGGIDEYYLLTGDERALEVISEQANWLAHMAETGGFRIAPERPEDKIGLEEYERPHAWPLYTLVKAYESTNDLRYWNAATIVMENIIDWWKMPQRIIAFDYNKPLDPTVPPENQAIYSEVIDFRKGNGYFLSTLRTDNSAKTNLSLNETQYQTHVPIAWMAAYLETSIIRYYENLRKMGSEYSATVSYRGRQQKITIEESTVREMMVQTLEVLVSHNWMSQKYPSKFPWLEKRDDRHWVYSASPERDPRSTDGDIQMPYVLLYAANFKKDEVSDRWKAHWEDIQRKWRDIALTCIDNAVNDQSPLTGYNGAPLLWNLPYSFRYMGNSN
jgi:hypothetical protein